MSKIIEIAKKELGYIEDKGNSTKYGKWFGLDGVAWCAMFVSWIYDQASKPLPKVGFTKGYASCQAMFEYAIKNKLLVSDPQEGDIVLFDWNGDKRHDHTGIFVKWIVKGRTFESIEGNTSLTNQSNGGSVMLRTRRASVAKFVRI
jgi:cell wall-associated NlpC family hydrolase